MEEILKKLGISEKTINEMMQICPDIKELEINEIFKKLEILKNIECEMQQTRNIVSSNPQYLIRTNTDINKTINKLKELGFKPLNILFDGNPYILNLDSYEIEEY